MLNSFDAFPMTLDLGTIASGTSAVQVKLGSVRVMPQKGRLIRAFITASATATAGSTNFAKLIIRATGTTILSAHLGAAAGGVGTLTSATPVSLTSKIATADAVVAQGAKLDAYMQKAGNGDAITGFVDLVFAPEGAAQ